MTPLESASILLALLLVLLTGGVWIAIALAAVAWFGLHFFTSTPPDVSPCTRASTAPSRRLRTQPRTPSAIAASTIA